MHVYCITNLVNGKIYVGQHSGDDLNNYLRLNIHRALFNESRREDKPLLYRSIRKYGKESFKIFSLVQPINKEQMNLLEKFFIRTLDSRNLEIGYNLAEGGLGGNTGTGRKHTLEEIEKQRKAMIGRVRSEEHRKNLSRAKTGKACPAVVESNIRRRDPNPSPSAIRNRIYRQRKKQRLLQCSSKNQEIQTKFSKVQISPPKVKQKLLKII